MIVAAFVAVHTAQVFVAVLHAELDGTGILCVEEPPDVPPPAGFEGTERHLNGVINR